MTNPVFDNPDRKWDIIPENIDLEYCRRTWKEGSISLHKTHKGYIARLDRGNPFYDIHISTRTFETSVPSWDLQITEKEWNEYILPHIISPSSFGKDFFDEDDIELAKIFMEELE